MTPVKQVQSWMLVPAEMIDSFPEINPNNYDHDQVCDLDAWGCDLIRAAIAAPKPPVQDARPAADCGLEVVAYRKPYMSGTDFMPHERWCDDGISPEWEPLVRKSDADARIAELEASYNNMLDQRIRVSENLMFERTLHSQTEAELAALKAQEPVAEVDYYSSVDGYGEEITRRLKVGTKLYAAPQPSDDVVKDAERWRMFVKICSNAMTPPDHRQHQKEWEAYRAAIDAGYSVEAAIDAAIDAATAGVGNE